MNIDDALPRSTPDVIVEAAFEGIELVPHPPAAATTVAADTSLSIPTTNPITDAPSTSGSGSASESGDDDHVFRPTAAPAPAIDLSPTSRPAPSRCHLPNVQPPPPPTLSRTHHVPSEDADYQQRIYGTGHLQHLLRNPTASDSQSDRESSCSPTSTIANPSATTSLDKMFAVKRSGMAARRPAYRSRILDRSATASGGLGDHFHTTRRVSFPENDAELVTGYLEPANPWATVKPVTSITELAELYRDSCTKHQSRPIDVILQHLNSLEDLSTTVRRPLLNLREQSLSAASCEALEEVLKRLQYKLIDLTACDLDDVSATALFDMIEYYEAASEVDISENRNITTRGWQSCINMIKRSHALEMLSTRKTPLSENNAANLGKALVGSSLHTLKLESCGLSGRPMNSLCNYLRRNTVLKELYLSDNDLTSADAFNVAIVLKANFHLNFLDVSNNKIEDKGLLHIVEALIEQAQYFRRIQDEAIAAAAAAAAAIVSASPPNTPIAELALTSSSQSTLLSSSTDDDDVITELPQIEANPPKRSTLETLLQTQKLHEDAAAQKKEPPLVAEVAAAGGEPAAATDTRNDNSTINNNHNNNNMLPATEGAGIELDLQQVLADSQPPLHPDPTAPSFDLNENQPDPVVRAAVAVETPPEADLIVFEDCDRMDGNPSAQTTTTSDGDDDNKSNDLVKQVQIESSNNRINNQSELSPHLLDPAMPLSPTAPTTTAMRPPTPAAIVPQHRHVIDSIQLKEATISTIEDVTTELVEFTPTTLPPSVVPFIMTLPPVTTTTTATAPTAATEIPTLTSENLKSHTSSNSSSPHPLLSKSLDSSLSSESLPNFHTQTSIAPERSFSLESLNSETSVDSNDSKSSIKLAEQKFNKNGTLERQQQTNTSAPSSAAHTPTGLQMLILWNNGITRESSKALSDLFAATTTLELLNVGRNVLSNDFLTSVKSSLKSNSSLTDLGLQSAHLTCAGVKTLSECLEFGGNSTLQRIDVRDNHLQVAGLTSLNDVLKSNKTVTRIELDDVPRRAHDLSADSTIDYSRMVTNIRTQCARNENPPKPEPVRTTAINKRVRGAHLNSRKISLTCHSIRSFEPPATSNAGTSTTAPTSIPPKGDRLLNPEQRKPSGGRLRSPLPSPSPSPTPSPSRNRFHVSRVLEPSSITQSATTSPMTPPSSSSCSPTSFFSATNHSHPPAPTTIHQHQPPALHSSSVPKISRFRVTTVVEHKLPKHKSLPDHLNQSNNSTILLPTVQHPTAPPIPADSSAKDRQPHLATTTTVTPTAQPTRLTDPTTPHIGLQPEPPQQTHQPPIEPIQSSNRHHLPYSHSQPELVTDRTTTIISITESAQLQPSATAIVSPVFVPNVVTPPPAAVPSTFDRFRKPDTLGAPSASNTPPHHKLSASLDSPDMEVKRYMDDSCSSVSSIDSIDRPIDYHHTSVSSLDSIDYASSAQHPRPKHLLSANTATATAVPVSTSHVPIPIFIDHSQCNPHSSLPSAGICPSKTIHDSLSSLETSIGSSSDSLFDDATLPGPPPPSSSNEGTLTNSPTGISSGCTSPSPSSEGERDVSVSPVKSERKRKTSWINPIAITKSDSGYPASLDKLLSLFHHPGNFFTRQSTNTSSTPTEEKKDKEAPGVQPTDKPVRKESPMSGLFGWSSMTRRDPDPCPDVAAVSSSPPATYFSSAVPPPLTKSIKSPLQPNWSPENTITAATTHTFISTIPSPAAVVIPPESPAEVTVPATTAAAAIPDPSATNIIVTIPDRLQNEMKENISPEHTITSAALISVKSQIPGHIQSPAATVPEAEKVLFELGGDDDEDDDDDESTAADGQAHEDDDDYRLKCAAQQQPPKPTALGMAGLGQITRDSLSILHGGASATNSRDSMRSLESLGENEFDGNA